MFIHMETNKKAEAIKAWLANHKKHRLLCPLNLENQERF